MSLVEYRPAGRKLSSLNGLRGLGVFPIDHGTRGPTTPPKVQAILAQLPAAQMNAIAGFFGSPKKPLEVLNFSQQWSNLAWNTRVGFERARARENLIDVARKLILSTDVYSFLETWNKHLIEMRQRWDAKYPAKTTFEQHLQSLPANEAVSDAVSLEAMRQAGSYASDTKFMVEFAKGTQETIRGIVNNEALIGGNDTLQNRFRMTGEAVGSVVEVATDALATLIAAILKGAVPPIAGAIPWWVWAAGGVIVLGAVGNILRPLTSLRSLTRRIE